MFLATSFMICNGYGLKGQNRCKTKSRSFVSGVFVMATFLLGAALYYEATAATSPVSYAAGGVFSPYASLQNFPYVTLTSPNAQLGGAFGYSVATSGSIVVVGAIFSEEHAYIFDAKNGGLINTLTSPTAEPFGGFGVSVATNGNIVVVGANLQTANGQMRAGHAYTFNATTGSLISMLTSPNAQLEGDFGYSVAASGDLVVVGAPFETVNGQGAGHAYVFNATTGTLIITLTSPNNQLGAQSSFGFSVATSGNIVVGGAQVETANGLPAAGHAYVFNATNGALISTLTSPNAQSLGVFGVSVAANGNIVLVGAPYESANGLRAAGHAYAFNAETGSLISILTSPDAESYGVFGLSVGIRGNIVVVGAPFETADGQGGAGHTYTFNAVTGILISTLTSPNVQVGSGFGMSVAASGNTLVIGAPFEAVTAFEQSAGHAGHAYASRLAPATGSPDCSKRCED